LRLQLPADGRQRVLIEGVAPEIEGGRFAIERTVGESVNVQAIVFADGHDSIACEVLYRSADSLEWRCNPMAAEGNDCREAEFPVDSLGRRFYAVQGWVDRFNTWHAGLGKRIAAGQELSAELPIGAELVEQAANRARGEDAARLSAMGRVAPSRK
jgi:starch synthase (maltosyl-transferring)